MSSRRVVVAGGSGFLGRSLARYLLAAGYEVDVLTRAKTQSVVGNAIIWDGAIVGDWARCVDGAAAVINLTGKSVNCRYNTENRGEITASRVNSVRAIEGAVTKAGSPPPVWIQSASLAIYGSPGADVCDETTPEGTGFSPEVCRQWESTFNESITPSTRKVLLRIGIVLGRDGGALETLTPLARWGLGGRVGNGRQYVSWIHIEDFNRMVEMCMARPDMSGVYNATAPDPVTNAAFMRTLRHAVHRPWSPPVPAWAVRLGTVVMRTESELALGGRRCLPKRILEQGFDFQHADLGAALQDALLSAAVPGT